MKNIEEALLGNQEMLYRIAARYLQSHDDILDVLQETAYIAIKNSHKIRDERYILTWIIRILIHNCLQTIKKNKKFPLLEFDENLYCRKDLENPQFEINDCLMKLGKNYRDVIVLKHIEGYKISEIAQIYNKPEGTIKTWLKRGLESLRNEVLQDE